MRRLEKTATMGFFKIVEMYPDNYILVRIVESDHDKGRQTGTALCISESQDELLSFAERENFADEVIILNGENLLPVLGGLL